MSAETNGGTAHRRGGVLVTHLEKACGTMIKQGTAVRMHNGAVEVRPSLTEAEAARRFARIEREYAEEFQRLRAKRRESEREAERKAGRFVITL